MSRNTPTADKTKPYHHGDLRNTLVLAATELIREHGVDNFAIVDAARIAGVSSAAPYRHFRDKDDLIEAVIRFGFDTLNLDVVEAVKDVPLGRRERIFAIGYCYLDFVIDNSSLFELMWGERGAALMRERDDPTTGFWMFVESVEAWCEAEGIEGEKPLELATELWATALGLASLHINQQLKAVLPEAKVEELLSASANSFLDGLKLKHGIK